MSWIFGAKSKNSHLGLNHKDILNKIGKTPRFKVQTSNIIILAGGLKETCLCNQYINNENSSGWIICGLGIMKSKGQFSIMDINNWDSFLKNDNFNPKALNGHYVIIIWNKNRVLLYTDQLELRRCYVMEHEDTFYFSTRLDWLLHFRKNNTIDFSSLGSQWTFINSFNNNCFIKNIHRLGSNAKAVITDKCKITSSDWEPSGKKYCKKDIYSLLEELTLLPEKIGKPLTLSLSGGRDSRALLSILMKHSTNKWATHTFGEKGLPDVEIACKIASKLNFKHNLYIYNSSDTDLLLEKCREISLHMEMTFSLFEYSIFSCLEQSYEQGFWMIDGGFGEYFRRSYGKKLLHRGNNALNNSNAEKLSMYFLLRNSPIFNVDLLKQINDSSLADLNAVLKKMPDIKTMPLGNWIDLLLIRTRLKNGPSNSQGFFELFIPNYMPYSQPIFLDAILSIHDNEKINDKLNIRIIENNCKLLTKFPYVRYNTTIPFSIAKNMYSAKIWALIKQKITKPFQPEWHVIVLKNLREYIIDTVNSSEVKSYSHYNYKFIKKAVDGFYSDNYSQYASVIYDWFNFEMWRQIL